MKFKPNPNDVVIVIMGPTGSGKTNFINALTGNAEHSGAAYLESPTQNVTPYTIPHHGFRLVLVDTPGFDDMTRSDWEVLQLTSEWLAKNYPDGETLKLIYLHRITEPRLSASTHKNLRIFGHLCGNIPLRCARLVTTMWDMAMDCPGRVMAENREKELRDEFWGPLVAEGAIVERFDNEHGSALRIVDDLIRMEIATDELLTQKELVEQQKSLRETEAGVAFYSRFQRLITKQRNTLKELAGKAKLQNDPNLTRNFQGEYDYENRQGSCSQTKPQTNGAPYNRTPIPHLPVEHGQGQLPRSQNVEDLIHVGGEFVHSEPLCVIDPGLPSSFNIILFGEAGVGKSSVINLIADKDVASTSRDVWGCTLESKQYRFQLARRTFNIWDTIGLGEPMFGATNYLSAIEKTHTLIRQVLAQGGLDLLLFCIPGSGSRITNTMVCNYRLFFEVLCAKRIPIAVVVTRLEDEERMEEWWERNGEYINQSGLKFGGHACITGQRGHPKAAEGRFALELLLLGYDHKGRYPMPPASAWFAGFVDRLPTIPRSKTLKFKQKELERLLRDRCMMDSADAQRLAENLVRPCEHDC